MGTRSITIFQDEQGNDCTILYRQYDGNPAWHGKELAEFISDIVMVNGMMMGDDRKLANGIGCLAAQVISHFKTSAGEFYIMPCGERDVWQEYEYYIMETETNDLAIKIIETGGRTLFEGNNAEFLNFCTNYEG